MNFRNYLSAIVFLALLIYGPLDHAWPGWFAIRLGYLILLPYGLWFLMGWFWDIFNINNHQEKVLERLLSVLVGAFLIFQAILKVTAKTHIGNTNWIRARDGMEDVGDDILLRGPDYGNVIILIIIALIFIIYGIFSKEKMPEK